MFPHFPTKNYTLNKRMRAYLNKRFWKAVCKDYLAKSVGRKKINTLFTSLMAGPYREKLYPRSRVRPSAFGLGPYSRPRAQFFPIRTSRLVNNIYLCHAL